MVNIASTLYLGFKIISRVIEAVRTLLGFSKDHFVWPLIVSQAETRT